MVDLVVSAKDESRQWLAGQAEFAIAFFAHYAC
jgi:hypothetical protein